MGGWLVKVSLFNEVFLLHAYKESSIDSLFKVFYNEVSQKFSFGNELDDFDLLFDEEITYTLDCCVNGRKQQIEPCGRLTSVFYNPVKWGFPYYIGYDRKKYSSNAGTKNLYIEYVKPEFVSTNIWLTNSNGTNYSILGENVFTFLQSETIYLELDKWNNYDELDMDSQNPNNDFNSNSTYNNKQNGKVNTAFAKIPTTIYPPGQQFDSRNGLLQNMAYFDPVIERIQEFKFKFRYHDGTPEIDRYYEDKMRNRATAFNARTGKRRPCVKRKKEFKPLPTNYEWVKPETGW